MNLSRPCKTSPGAATPTSHLAALANASEGERAAVYADVKATAPTVTMSAIKEAVAVKTDKTEELGSDSQRCESSTVRSIVNGKPAEDPADIAEGRLNGSIPVDATVTITEPAGDREEPAEDRPPAQAELSDEDWLAMLPLSRKLTGSSLKTFEIDALVYRAAETHRATYGNGVRKILRGADRKWPGGTIRRGRYARQIRSFLQMNHPKNWLICPPKAAGDGDNDGGGCDGAGALPLLPTCPKCGGCGYLVW